MLPGQRHIFIVHSAGDLAYLERLRPAGFRFTLMKKRPSEEDRRRFDDVIDWDYQEDVAATVALARRLHRSDPVAGVTSFSESGVIMAAILAKELGLPGNTPGAALRARDKYLMRRAFEAARMANPPFHLVRSAEEIAEHVRQLGAPMVLKPISGSSSYGVVRIRPDDELATIAAHLEEVREYIAAYRQNNPRYPFEFWLPEAGYGIDADDVHDPAEVFLLEGYIGGQQVSVDGFVAAGHSICLGVIEIERIKNSNYFLEYEEWMPTRLGQEAEDRICAAAARAVRALGLTDSCFHCELKVDGDRIFVLELAARRGADNIADFVRRLYGVDVYEEGVRLATGERRVQPRARTRGAMKMRYFLPETAGELVAIEGLEEVRRDPRVCELELEFVPGDEILMPLSVTATVERQVLGVVERGCRGRSAVAVETAERIGAAAVRPAGAPFARVIASRLSGEEGHHPRAGIDLADAAVPLAADVQVAVVVDGDARGRVELGFERVQAFAAAPHLPIADYGSQHPGPVIDASDRVGAFVRSAGAQLGKEQVPLGVEAEVVRRVHASLEGGAAVAGVAGHAVTGESVEDALPVDAPDAVAPDVGEDEVAVGATHDAHRPTDVSLGRGDALAVPDAGNRGDMTGAEPGEVIEQIHATSVANEVRGGNPGCGRHRARVGVAAAAAPRQRGGGIDLHAARRPSGPAARG